MSGHTSYTALLAMPRLRAEGTEYTADQLRTSVSGAQRQKMLANVRHARGAVAAQACDRCRRVGGKSPHFTQCILFGNIPKCTSCTFVHNGESCNAVGAGVPAPVPAPAAVAAPAVPAAPVAAVVALPTSAPAPAPIPAAPAAANLSSAVVTTDRTAQAAEEERNQAEEEEEEEQEDQDGPKYEYPDPEEPRYTLPYFVERRR